MHLEIKASYFRNFLENFRTSVRVFFLPDWMEYVFYSSFYFNSSDFWIYSKNQQIPINYPIYAAT